MVTLSPSEASNIFNYFLVILWVKIQYIYKSRSYEPYTRLYLLIRSNRNINNYRFKKIIFH